MYPPVVPCAKTFNFLSKQHQRRKNFPQTPKNSEWMTRAADETSWNARTVWNVTTFWLFGRIHFPCIFPNWEIGRVREFRQRISTKCSDAWPKTKRKSCSALATFSPEPPINLPSHPFLRNNSPMARKKIYNVETRIFARLVQSQKVAAFRPVNEVLSQYFIKSLGGRRNKVEQNCRTQRFFRGLFTALFSDFWRSLSNFERGNAKYC